VTAITLSNYVLDRALQFFRYMYAFSIRNSPVHAATTDLPSRNIQQEAAGLADAVGTFSGNDRGFGRALFSGFPLILALTLCIVDGLTF
jgi:hypothetical protein